MESKLLLVKVITLLYKEALIKEPQARSTALATEVIESIRLPETGAEFAGARERLLELKKTATWMVAASDNGPFDKPALLQRIRVAAGEDDSIYAAFELGMEDPLELEGRPNNGVILKQCSGIKSELQDHLDSRRFLEIAKSMYQRAAFGQGPAVELRSYFKEVARELNQIAKGMAHQRIKGLVDEIYFENEESTIDIMQRAKDALSRDGALKFGQQAINEACYDHPGALRGEFWLVSAISHNYKSGFGLTNFVDLALYNTPWMIDIHKKPMLLHISTENEATQNALTVYAMLMERETGQPCSTANVDPVVAAHYVKEKLSVNGYHTAMCRVDPSDTCVFDIFDLIEQKEEEGYEIHGVILDYPAMLDKKGLSISTTGSELRDLLRRLRNFFTKRKTFCMVFHQLGPMALQLERQGMEDLVKEVAGKGMYDGSSKLFQEVDVDISLHIERLAESSWLTMQWAKHRKLKRTPREKWYAAMPLTDIGGLLPDVDKEPHFVRDLKPLRQRAGNRDWFHAAVAA